MSAGNPLAILSHVPGALLAPLRARFPAARVHEIPSRGPIPDGADGEILLTWTQGSENLPAALERGVRWVHAYGTGVDRFPFELLGDRLLTCSRGASALPIAEWVLAVMLAAEKCLPESWLEHPPEHWSMARLGSLRGRQLAILGFGGIGQEVARLALAFGMRVRALRRGDAPSPLPDVALARDLPGLLADADHLVVAAPATPDSRGLLDRNAFACLKPGVHLVNVARGEIVDQDALREALDGGRVARASLDVATPEPLPQGHWLYAHPQVRLSPHVSWSAPDALPELLAPFLEDLERWRRGEPLRNRVDVQAGY